MNFPTYESKKKMEKPPPGILINLQRLNVPCNTDSYLKISDSEKKICGKLEELNSNERTYHFEILEKSAKIEFFKNPMFSLTYKLVDYCYNLTLKNETGEFYVVPTGRNLLECYFQIHLPYGNQVDLQLVINNKSEIIKGQDDKLNYRNSKNIINTITLRTNSKSNNRSKVSSFYLSDNYFRDNSRTRNYNNYNEESEKSVCGSNLFIQIYENTDANSKWTNCVNNETSSTKQYNFLSESNKLIVHLFRQKLFENIITTTTTKSTSTNINSPPTIYFSYVAKPIPEIISECAFGWIVMQPFCIKPFHVLKTWIDAEYECGALGGHLTSIRNQDEHDFINNILINR